MGPNGETWGYHVDISAISVSEENIFYNYDTSNAASVTFYLSNDTRLQLYFGEAGRCIFIAYGKRSCDTPAVFRKEFPVRVSFTPVLGPVEHNEKLYEREAAQRALYHSSAARNFRNIWHHFPDKFDDFREILRRTWPGMDVERPRISYESGPPILHMLCPEERIPREICWAGFGFQVWCQMLTHLIQARDSSIFLIDEPDIYLHSDLQRQLLTILRELGPDILIATHSTEIITEAEADEIVVVDKKRGSGKRIKRPGELGGIFGVLGSSLNPVLTQLAKTRRAVFVEGKDFQILARFADKLNLPAVSTRSKFAVIPIEGFNPQKIKHFIEGIQLTLGTPILAMAVLDRDYRSDAERKFIEKECEHRGIETKIHSRKEIENYLLIPDAIDRAAKAKIAERKRRGGRNSDKVVSSRDVLSPFANESRNFVTGQYIAKRTEFEKRQGSGKHDSTISTEVLDEIDKCWENLSGQLNLIPGKEALSRINSGLQATHSVTVSPTAIIKAMKVDEIPEEMADLLKRIDEFSRQPISSD